MQGAFVAEDLVPTEVAVADWDHFTEHLLVMTDITCDAFNKLAKEEGRSERVVATLEEESNGVRRILIERTVRATEEGL